MSAASKPTAPRPHRQRGCGSHPAPEGLVPRARRGPAGAHRATSTPRSARSSRSMRTGRARPPRRPTRLFRPDRKREPFTASRSRPRTSMTPKACPPRPVIRRWPSNVARADAFTVARMKAAGAVLIGKTVTTQFAAGDPSPTRNPWRADRTPGGSSSGSARGRGRPPRSHRARHADGRLDPTSRGLQRRGRAQAHVRPRQPTRDRAARRGRSTMRDRSCAVSRTRPSCSESSPATTRSIPARSRRVPSSPARPGPPSGSRALVFSPISSTGRRPTCARTSSTWWPAFAMPGPRSPRFDCVRRSICTSRRTA